MVKVSFKWAVASLVAIGLGAAYFIFQRINGTTASAKEAGGTFAIMIIFGLFFVIAYLLLERKIPKL